MSNRESILQLYSAFLAHDPDLALSPFNDDSVWLEPDGNGRSGFSAAGGRSPNMSSTAAI